MKKTFFPLLAVFVLLLALSCSPKLRVQNDLHASFLSLGITEYVVKFDKAAFDVINLSTNNMTAYKSVDVGDKHTVSTRINGFETEWKSDALLRIGTKYTVGLNAKVVYNTTWDQ